MSFTADKEIVLAFSFFDCITYSACSVYSYKNKERNATTPVLDIGLLTGFTVSTKDLDLVRKIRTHGLKVFRIQYF